MRKKNSYNLSYNARFGCLKGEGSTRITVVSKVKTHIPKKAIHDMAQTVCRKVGFAGQLSLVVVGEATIARLNYEALGRVGSTDVLSFSYHTPRVAGFKAGDTSEVTGELVLCLSVVRRRAKTYGESFSTALRRTIVHGILHLIGYTHDTARMRLKMKRIEDSLVD